MSCWAPLLGMTILAAACSSPPRSVPAPPTPTTSTPPATSAALLIGPTWVAVVVTEEPAPAAYGLRLSPQTAVQVPGYGSLTLEQAQAFGGRPLVASAVSGLLGIGLDRSTVVADASPPPLAGGALYGSLPIRPSPSEVQALVSAHLGPVRLTSQRAFGRKVALLDGSGSPTAARQAALLLTAAGFQTVRQAPAGGGARATTQIVVYSGTVGSLQTGRAAADALGVGDVAASNQPPEDGALATPQSGVVVDVTVTSDLTSQPRNREMENRT